MNIFVDLVRESSTFGFILAREGPLYRGDPEGGARRAANEGSRSGRNRAAATRKVMLMTGAGRQARGRAARGRFSGKCSMGRAASPSPGLFGRTKPTADFGRTKPTVDSLDRITAWSPAAPASRAGQSATRCPASLGQHKSLPRKALSRVVPLSRGCGIGTLRQLPFMAAPNPVRSFSPHEPGHDD